jgi:RES domain-containing protein
MGIRQPLAACPVVGWESSTWRIHNLKYPAEDPGGARLVSGRYNRGLDMMPEISLEQVFGALYLATGPEIAIAELVRHLPENSSLRYLNNYRLSELCVQMSEVLDCRDPGRLELTLEDMCHDTDYRITQEIGATVFAAGLEGLLVPSATRLGDNLILFPVHLRGGSRIEMISSRHPRLYPQDD